MNLDPAMQRFASALYPDCFGKQPFNIIGCCEGHVKLAAVLTELMRAVITAATATVMERA